MSHYKDWVNEVWVDEIWAKIEKKLSVVAVRSKDKIPYTTINGTHDNKAETDISWWTNGFWAGLMWLMYIVTKNETYKVAAENSEVMLDRALKDYDGLHHDVGFMWHITSGVNYRLSGNKDSKVRNMYAANVLAGRFNLAGKFIRAWNKWDPSDFNTGWTIIDSMMNIPLLYWASKESDDPRFSYIAIAHADTTMDMHVRPDGSVVHIVVHDHINGGKIGEETGQGYAIGSSWSRGQAWALYGFVLSYIYTKNEAYLDTAKKVAHYFIADLAMKDDYLPDCDLRQPKDKVVKDSSAGAIAACGLIEIARHAGEHEKDLYLTGALWQWYPANKRMAAPAIIGKAHPMAGWKRPDPPIGWMITDCTPELLAAMKTGKPTTAAGEDGKRTHYFPIKTSAGDVVGALELSDSGRPGPYERNYTMAGH